jgi:hypothetical protein
MSLGLSEATRRRWQRRFGTEWRRMTLPVAASASVFANSCGASPPVVARADNCHTQSGRDTAMTRSTFSWPRGSAKHDNA